MPIWLLDRHAPSGEIAAENARWATGRWQAFNELLGILPLPQGWQDAENPERREMRGEDYRGRGGGVGKGLLAPVLGMNDIINIMESGREI